MAVQPVLKPSIPTEEQLYERARGMVPRLLARWSEADAGSKVPAQTVAEMQEAGFFRVLQPRRYGGYEMNPRVFYNVQMILAEGCMSTAWIYGVLAVDQEVANRIYDQIAGEYRRTADCIARITGHKTVLEQMPILQHSIQRRTPYVDALSFIQLVILRRLRSARPDEPRDELLEGVLESMGGIASGLKNTG